MSRLFILFCYLLMSFAGTSSFAREPEYSFQIEGNERTKTFYIKHLAEHCLRIRDNSDTESPALVLELKQCLMNSQLFSDVTVESKVDQIHIHVDERWTLIPIPYAQAGSGGDRSAGLFVLESNLFGIGQLAAIGGTISNRGDSLIGFFQDQHLFQTHWTTSLSALRVNQEVFFFQNRDDAKTDFAGFKEHRASAAMNLGYNLSKDSLISAELRRSSATYQTLEPYNLNPSDHDDLIVAGKLKLGRTNYRLFYQHGAWLEVAHARQAMRTDTLPRVTQTIGQAHIAMPAFASHAFKLSFLGGRVAGGDEADLLRVGERPGFRGIPKTGVWVETYKAMIGEYMIPIEEESYGTWVVSGLAEGGRLKAATKYADEEITYQTYGAGVYLYLKKIAIPGIGLEVGHNSAYMPIFATASFGLSLN